MADETTITAHVTKNGFPRLARELPQRVEDAVRKAATDIESGAKVRAAVDTGFMRSSVKSERVGPAHYRVTVGAEYAQYVELGTRNMHAQPFLRPAYDAVIPAFRRALERIVEE